jgi:hypothetical protein
MGYKLETTALISIDNYNAFRITCIMLIVGNLQKTIRCYLSKTVFQFEIHSD